jgi:hypothetical protein
VVDVSDGRNTAGGRRAELGARRGGDAMMREAGGEENGETYLSGSWDRRWGFGGARGSRKLHGQA